MPQLLSGAGDSFSAKTQPLYHLFSQKLQAGTGGLGLERAGEKIENAASDFVTMQGQQEVRQVQVKAAQLRAAAQQQIDDAVQNGGDLTAVEAGIDNQFAGLGDGMTTVAGSQAAKLYGASHTADLNKAIYMAQVKQFGQTAKTQADQWSAANGAVLSRDPSQLNNIEADADNFAATLKNVPPEFRNQVATELKQNMNQAAVSALILQNPAGVKGALQNGAFNLSSQQREQLIDKAQEQVRTNQVQQELNLSLQLRQQTVNNDAALKAWVPKILDGTANLSALSADKNLTGEGMENLTEFAHRVATQGPTAQQSDPATFNSYQHRLALPAGSPGALDADSLKAAMQPDLTAGKISLPDALRLQKDADAWQSNDPGVRQITLMREGATKQFGMFDPLNASSDAYKFQMDAEAALKKAEGAGVNPQTTIFNPKSPEYLLAPNNLAKYTAPPSVQAQAAGVRAAPSYQVGQVVQFAQGPFQFKGGDPTNKDNWEPAE